MTTVRTFEIPDQFVMTSSRVLTAKERVPEGRPLTVVVSIVPETCGGPVEVAGVNRSVGPPQIVLGRRANGAIVTWSGPRERDRSQGELRFVDLDLGDLGLVILAQSQLGHVDAYETARGRRKVERMPSGDVRGQPEKLRHGSEVDAVVTDLDLPSSGKKEPVVLERKRTRPRRRRAPVSTVTHSSWTIELPTDAQWVVREPSVVFSLG